MKINRSALACLAGAVCAPLVLAAAPIAAADTTDTAPPVRVPTHPFPAFGAVPGSDLAPYPSGTNPYVTFGTNPYVPFGVETAF
jgi:hypothetical protein